MKLKVEEWLILIICKTEQLCSIVNEDQSKPTSNSTMPCLAKTITKRSVQNDFYSRMRLFLTLRYRPFVLYTAIAIAGGFPSLCKLVALFLSTRKVPLLLIDAHIDTLAARPKRIAFLALGCAPY